MRRNAAHPGQEGSVCVWLPLPEMEIKSEIWRLVFAAHQIILKRRICNVIVTQYAEDNLFSCPSYARRPPRKRGLGRPVDAYPVETASPTLGR